MLKAGYLEDWRHGETLSGAAQGGVASPLLSNIYLDKLDRFVEETLFPIYNRGDRRAQTALVVTRERGEGKKPLMAMFGGVSLAWKKDEILSDRPPAVYSGIRSEIVQL